MDPNLEDRVSASRASFESCRRQERVERGSQELQQVSVCSPGSLAPCAADCGAFAQRGGAGRTLVRRDKAKRSSSSISKEALLVCRRAACTADASARRRRTRVSRKIACENKAGLLCTTCWTTVHAALHRTKQERKEARRYRPPQGTTGKMRLFTCFEAAETVGGGA